MNHDRYVKRWKGKRGNVPTKGKLIVAPFELVSVVVSKYGTPVLKFLFALFVHPEEYCSSESWSSRMSCDPPRGVDEVGV